MSHSFSLCFLFITILHIAAGNYKLVLLDRLFLPAEYDPDVYKYDQHAAKQMAYDRVGNTIYVVGTSYIHVVNALSPRFLKLRHHEKIDGYKLTDVEFCNQYVIVSAESLHNNNDGVVNIYQKFHPVDLSMTLLHSIQLAADPNMVAVTSDCRTIVAAIEGKPYLDGEDFIDPEGAVHIIHFLSDDLSQPFQLKKLDFKAFDPVDYEARGVRFIYKENSNTFAQDLEPEYVTITSDNSLAYVSLQENNAIATVNISVYSTASITELYPLGTKDWSQTKLDPSDLDGGINLRNWEIRGMYLPDMVKFFEVNNNPYILTFNEGDHKDYASFSEVKRGQDFVNEGLVHETVPPIFRDELAVVSRLGRLKFTNVNGKFPGSEQFNSFHTFGARGFTIRSALDDLPIIHDSGSSFEESISENLPDLFNVDAFNAESTVAQSFDLRSADRGPECESGDLGVINGDTVMFIGNEPMGTISIYSVRHDLTNPVFHSIKYGGNLTSGDTWEYQYEVRRIGDIDPEGIHFVSGRDSPVLGEDLLMVSGVASGSIAVYKIIFEEGPSVPERLDVEMRRLFDMADEDRNEFVTKPEFRIFIMKDADGNADGVVSESEFEHDWVINKQVPLNPTGLQRSFNALDVDNNESIEPDDCDKFVDTVTDKDGNGMLTIDEWNREWRGLLDGGVDWE